MRSRFVAAGAAVVLSLLTSVPIYGAKAAGIVSTFLTKVSPGQSIQKAIDSIPPEGGIVELASGTHEVNDTLYPPCTFDYSAHPKAGFSKEQAPGGKRVNIGAYGNTTEASKSRKK